MRQKLETLDTDRKGSDYRSKVDCVTLLVQNVCCRFIPMEGPKKEFHRIAMSCPELMPILILNTFLEEWHVFSIHIIYFLEISVQHI